MSLAVLLQMKGDDNRWEDVDPMRGQQTAALVIAFYKNIIDNSINIFN